MSYFKKSASRSLPECVLLGTLVCFAAAAAVSVCGAALIAGEKLPESAVTAVAVAAAFLGCACGALTCAKRRGRGAGACAGLTALTVIVVKIAVSAAGEGDLFSRGDAAVISALICGAAAALMLSGVRRKRR